MTDLKPTFRQLLAPTDPQFRLVVDHQEAWWAEEFGVGRAQVELFQRCCLGENVPYTYVMEKDGQLAGFYLVIPNDLFTRPDLGPWFSFAYIVPEYRGRGYFRLMNEAVIEHAREHGLKELYLHTRHEGLYEKFGWEQIESSADYKADGILRRIYRRRITP